MTRIYRNLFFSFILFYFSTSIFSQKIYTNEPGGSINFSGGLTSSKYTPDSSGLSPIKLFTAGIYGSIVLNQKFNINLGAYFSGKGFIQDKGQVKFRLFYADFPLYIQYKIIDNIMIDGGFQYSQFAGGVKVFSDSTGVNKDKLSFGKANDNSVFGGIEFRILKDFSLGARYIVSTDKFLNPKEQSFSVFQFTLNYTALTFYEKIFGKRKIKEEKP